MKLKLTIEQVPESVWYHSISKLYKIIKQPEKWQKIEKNLVAKEGNRCWICGMEGVQLQGHEIWRYDELNKIMYLTTIHLLCNLCHKIKNFWFWCRTSTGPERLAAVGLSEDGLIEHFCKVNNCSPEIFAIHAQETLELHNMRSKIDWEKDFGDYDQDKAIRTFLNTPTRSD